MWAQSEIFVINFSNLKIWQKFEEFFRVFLLFGLKIRLLKLITNTSDCVYNFTWNTFKAGFTQATSARLRSQAMLHFEVVWLDCAATVEKISPARWQFSVCCYENFSQIGKCCITFHKNLYACGWSSTTWLRSLAEVVLLSCSSFAKAASVNNTLEQIFD